MAVLLDELLAQLQQQRGPTQLQLPYPSAIGPASAYPRYSDLAQRIVPEALQPRLALGPGMRALGPAPLALPPGAAAGPSAGGLGGGFPGAGAAGGRVPPRVPPITSGMQHGGGGFLGSVPGLNKLPKQFPGVLGTKLGRGGIAVGLPVAASMLPIKGTGGRVARTAATGAGIGAFLGPKGMLVGGLIGAGAGLLGFGKGKKQPSPDQQLAAVLANSGLDDQTSLEINAYYRVLSKLGGDSKEAKANALQQVGQMVIQEMKSRAEAEESLGSMDIASIQAQSAALMQPFADQAMRSATAQANYLTQMAPSLPPAYRDVVRVGAINQLGSASRLSSAYQAQAALAPVAQAINTQQEYLNRAASTLVGQGIQGAISGTGESTDFDQILAQQLGQG